MNNMNFRRALRAAREKSERERAEREARMRAQGHVPLSEDEKQSTFEATIHAIENEPGEA